MARDRWGGALIVRNVASEASTNHCLGGRWGGGRSLACTMWQRTMGVNPHMQPICPTKYLVPNSPPQIAALNKKMAMYERKEKKKQSTAENLGGKTGHRKKKSTAGQRRGGLLG